MKTPILGSAYVARSVNAADNRMVNLFPEIIPEGGKEPAFLNRAPGLKFLQTVGTGPIRGLWSFRADPTRAFVVSGSELYEINNSYTATLRGAVGGTGSVSMADNGTQIFIAANPKGYIFNTSTNVFAEIIDPDFPGAITVSFLDGYFIFNPPNSQKFYITGLLDGTSVDPLDFASAEGSSDGLVALIVDHRELWLFGTDSVEVWYDAGLSDFPFVRIQGAFNELGCAAPYSVAKLDNGLFWLGSDSRGKGIVYRAEGYTGKRMSTHAVEWQIQQYGDISDAIAYTYQQDGHAFYVLIFPSANTTWVFDVATQAWHERAGFVNGNFTRHRSNCQMAYNGEVIVGDYENGNIYSFDLDVFADNGQIQKWLRSWRALPTGQNNLKRTAQHSLQLDCETGVGLNGYSVSENIYLFTENNDYLVTESNDRLICEDQTIVTQGANPEVMLRWSDDGGHTWSNEHWVSMGKIGEYGHRTYWRRLGMTLKLRDRVYELSATDPVKIAIMGAELMVSGTNA
jgi:hypothetical protein